MNKDGMDTNPQFLFIFLGFCLQPVFTKLGDNSFYLANLMPVSSNFFLEKLWIYWILDKREWTERGLQGPFLMKSILLGSWSAGKIMPS